MKGQKSKGRVVYEFARGKTTYQVISFGRYYELSKVLENVDTRAEDAPKNIISYFRSKVRPKRAK